MKKKTIFIMIMAFVLVAMEVFLPYSALSTKAAETVASGKCGSSLKWSINDKGVMTISGKGNIPDYVSDIFEDSRPWADYSWRVEKIVVKKGVKSIGTDAFRKFENLTEINLPEGLKLVGERAFDECHSLEEAVIPEGCEKIGEYAFIDAGIKKLTLPDTLMTISEAAFAICESLTEVYIPQNVSEIGDGAFSSCVGVKKYEVDPDNRYFSSRGGVLMNKSGNVLIQYPEGSDRSEYSIPVEVTELYDGCFESCKNLEKIVIPKTVTKIGMGIVANYGRNHLWTIAYEGSETEWDDIEISDYNEDLENSLLYFNGEEPDIVELKCKGGSVYFEKTKQIIIGSDEGIKSVKIPETISGVQVKEIGALAFKERKHLKKIVMSSGVKSIGNYAFDKCTALKNVKLPDTLREIGESAFYGCSNLKEIKLNQGLETIDWLAYEDCESLTHIIIPDTVTYVGNQAFMDCDSMKYVMLSSGMTVVTMHTLECGSELKAVYIPDSIDGIAHCPGSSESFPMSESITDIFYSGSKEKLNDSYSLKSELTGYGLNIEIHYNATKDDFLKFVSDL